MGLIINIDEALKLRSDYNVLREPLNQMLRDRQEAWEKENPIDLLFVRGTLNSFQETYTSSIGFAHAFAETADFTVGPIFNTAEGFAATYRSRTFQGGFIITQQVLEDGQMRKIKDDASAFVKRWHADVVEYAIAGLAGGFGEDAYFETKEGRSRIRLMSADTVDGDVMNTTKNPLFTNNHKTVKRDADSTVYTQSNLFYVADDDLAIGGDDAGQISKLADVINQVITIQENYRDDNGKRAGVNGAKTIVTGNDAHLKAAIATALSTDVFAKGETKMPNPAKDRATLKTSPYYLDIDMCKDGAGFFIVDKAYNEANHGLEFTERVPFTLNAFEKKEAPMGIKYEGRQRFDINVASWRGITYVRLGTPKNTNNGWDKLTNYTRITPIATIVKPVTVVGTVDMKTQTQA